MPASNATRQELIVNALIEAFGPLMEADPDGFRTKFRKAAKRCQNVTNSRRWAYDGPTAQEWKAGNHFMVCFKPD